MYLRVAIGMSELAEFSAFRALSTSQMSYAAGAHALHAHSGRKYASEIYVCAP